MSLFANMKHHEDIAAPKDTLGGGNYIKESNVYTAVIKMAYAFKSDAGAQGVAMEFLLQDGSTYKEKFYVSKTTGENYSEKDGKKFYMQGFVTVDEICALSTGQYLANQTAEDKLIKVYQYPEGEVEKEMPVLTDLINKKVLLAIQQVRKYKSEKQGAKWVETWETQDINEISKVFNTDKFTVAELMEEKEEPTFHDKWLEKNEGEVYDRTKNKKPKGATGTGPGTGTGSPKAGAPANSAPKTLFNRK